MQKNKFFSLPEPEFLETSDEVAKASEIFISKYLNKHYQKIKSLPEDLMRLPSEEEIFFLQTDNSFNAFTFIPLIAKNQGIKELYASTYSINIRVIESLLELHDNGLIEQITLMISDSLIKRNPKTIDLLEALVSSRANITVNYSWNHSKVCIMKTAFNHFVVEGSGNWSENAFYEQYLFANSKGIYEFRKEMFTNAKLR
jgi:hypothetical protein